MAALLMVSYTPFYKFTKPLVAGRFNPITIYNSANENNICPRGSYKCKNPVQTEPI